MPPENNSKDGTTRGGIRYTPDNPPTDNKTTTPPPTRPRGRPPKPSEPDEPTE